MCGDIIGISVVDSMYLMLIDVVSLLCCLMVVLLCCLMVVGHDGEGHLNSLV